MLVWRSPPKSSHHRRTAFPQSPSHRDIFKTVDIDTGRNHTGALIGMVDDAGKPPAPADESPMRILSLLPSITEIVSALGLDPFLVGVTHQCDFPPEVVSRAPVITTCAIDPSKLTQAEINEQVAGSIARGQSLYGLKEKELKELQPTIIFTQALCDVCAVNFETVNKTCSRVLQERPARVVSLEPTNVNDMMQTVLAVGRECGVEDRAEALVQRMTAGLVEIRSVATEAADRTSCRPRVAFLEWLDPLFFGGHWIPDMIDAAGGVSSFGEARVPSCGFSDEDLQKEDPDIIVVAPCGFSLEKCRADMEAMLQEKPWWRELRAVKEGRLFAVDANSFFSRPSPRLLEGTAILARILHGVETGLVPKGSWIALPS